jgi:hypothetical protein
MIKLELTYAEIELLQFLLGKIDMVDYFINEEMEEKINALKLKLIAMKAQLEKGK